MNFRFLDDIYLPVSNLEKSAEWYAEHFGLKATRRDNVEHAPAAALSFASTGFVLVQSDTVNRYTHIPFNFHTNRIEELHLTLQAKGVIVTKLIADEGMLCCDFYDPDGNRVGLCYELAPEGIESHLEVGGTFLTVRDLDASVRWYQDKLGFDFHYFSATGAAGYVGPTPDYVEGLTIRYAGFKPFSPESPWSRMALVETPVVYPLVHIPYTIQSSDAEENHRRLRALDVQLSDFQDDGSRKQFYFYDYDGNPIGIVQNVKGEKR